MLHGSEQFNNIIQRCQNSRVGKLLPNALYVHTSAIAALDPLLQDYAKQAQTTTDQLAGANLVKFSTDRPKISYLFYPDFDSDPHPALHRSIVVNMETLQVTDWDYREADNPPVLHRKETFVTADYPLYQEFAQLTYFEAALGLLENSRFIGTRQEWQQRLAYHGVALEGHRLICHLQGQSSQPLRIERHKAAIVRNTLSRPVRLALEAALLTPETSFFDYGCGYGGDVERLSQRGNVSSGWDPYYRPETPCIPADIVNLGYVINVIEDLAERREALVKAWELTRQVLIVAAQVLIDDRDRGVVAYGDGVITRRNTFQKYYEQEELKAYIDQVLEVEAIPAGLGVYLVFRDETQAQAFRASRFHSRAQTPTVKAKVRRYEDYEDLLVPLMEFVTERGRLPASEELANFSDLKAEFGTMRRAFDVILQVTEETEWEAIAEKRRQELLLYLALSQFTHRPQPRQLSPQVREDIKALFGSYRQACLLADMMLFSLRDLKNIGDICQGSSVGKKLRHSLLVHISALESLDPLLRLYEGCASRTAGRLEDANLIKFSWRKPKISYLFYPHFESEAHPVLATSMEIDLRDLQVRYRDYLDDDNPPLLHEKEAVVTPDYPLYPKFARLTRQEKDWGLLDDNSPLIHRQEWLQSLADHCATLKGNQLCWRKDADPYKVKVLRSQIEARKKERKKLC